MTTDTATFPTYRITGYVDTPSHRLHGQLVSEKIVEADEDSAMIAAHEAARFAGFDIIIDRVEITRTPAQKLRSRQIARANRLRKASR